MSLVTAVGNIRFPIYIKCQLYVKSVFVLLDKITVGKIQSSAITSSQETTSFETEEDTLSLIFFRLCQFDSSKELLAKRGGIPINDDQPKSNKTQ